MVGNEVVRTALISGESIMCTVATSFVRCCCSSGGLSGSVVCVSGYLNFKKSRGFGCSFSSTFVTDNTRAMCKCRGSICVVCNKGVVCAVIRGLLANGAANRTFRVTGSA